MKKIWKIAFTVVVFVLLFFALRGINFAEIWMLLGQMNVFYLTLAFLTYFMAFLIFNFRSMYSLGWIIPNPDFFFYLKTLLAGFFINTITPGAQIGGEPVRAYFISGKYKKPVSKVFGAILGDRFSHAVVSILFIVFSIIFLFTFISLPRELEAILETVLTLILVLAVVLVILNTKKTKAFLRPLFRKAFSFKFFKKTFMKKFLNRKVTKGFGNFADSFKRTIGTRRLIVLGFVFSTIYWGLNFFVPYFLFLSLGVQVSFFTVLVAVSIGGLIGDFSPSPGGLGLVEGSMVFVYILMGVGFPVAFTVSVINRIILYFFAIAVGGLSLLALNRE